MTEEMKKENEEMMMRIPDEMFLPVQKEQSYWTEQEIEEFEVEMIKYRDAQTDEIIELISEKSIRILTRLHIEKSETEDKITELLKEYDVSRLNLDGETKYNQTGHILNMIQCKCDIKIFNEKLFNLNEKITYMEAECINIFETGQIGGTSINNHIKLWLGKKIYLTN